MTEPPQYSVLYAYHGDPQRLCPIPRCASSALFTVLFSLILYSVPVCATDYPSHTFEDTCVTPAATFCLAPPS